jgi:Protein of unknown function (DUF3326)
MIVRRPAFASSASLSLQNGPRCTLRRSPPLCSLYPGGYTAVAIVPTGISAAIGGYAGDALPSARLLSTVVDTLITHPNVLNGALMYYPIANALYVEGLALDAFAAGRLRLRPPAAPTNRVGILLDAAMPAAARTRHLQAADAARATLGLDVASYTVTDTPLGVRTAASGDAGASWGTLDAPAALLRGAERLLASGKVDAIAVVGQFPDEDEDALAEYRAGDGVDAIAGAEAVISHLVTRELGVPCAHAPALPPLDVDETVSPKAAAEELGYTFLSCVLVGLSRAPALVEVSGVGGDGSGGGVGVGGLIDVADVDALVVPADAFGGAALMSLAERPRLLVVAVEENVTGLGVGPEAVGIRRDRIVWVRNYAEAAGVLAAHKAGIALRSLSANVCHIPLV